MIAGLVAEVIWAGAASAVWDSALQLCVGVGAASDFASSDVPSMEEVSHLGAASKNLRFTGFRVRGAELPIVAVGVLARASPSKIVYFLGRRRGGFRMVRKQLCAPLGPVGNADQHARRSQTPDQGMNRRSPIA